MYQYIPAVVTPNARKWRSGETVLLRMGDHTWPVTMVFSTGLPRFSSGWNKFAADNELAINKNLLFTLFQTEDGVIFNVQRQ